MPTAIQVADWIIRHQANDLGAPVDAMSLEKLVYYAQSFRLALTGAPLFEDEVRAWRHGPVIPSVYRAYEGSGAQPIVPTDSEDAELDDSIEQHLQSIVGFFGRYTAIELSNATHAEEPWIEARRGLHRRAPSNVLIPQDRLRTYYSALIWDGEAALSRHEMLAMVPEPRWGWLYVAGICARMMTSHPFYALPLAEKMSESVPAGADSLADELYAPIGKPDYVDLGDIRELSAEGIVRRAAEKTGAE